MKIEENVSLTSYSTMRLGGKARFLCSVSSEKEIEGAIEFARKRNLKIHVVGGGSNTIFSDGGFDGLVLANQVRGVDIDQDDDSAVLTVGAGEEWDGIVKQSVELGYCDIAALSLIPGSTGAAPVQNIGAYGQQLSDCVISVRAFDLEENTWVEILQQDCNFSYRTSRFNSSDKGRFIIASVKLRLDRKAVGRDFYSDIERYLNSQNIALNDVSPVQLREAVIAVRQAKLPDPNKIANTGSFFKNPIVSPETLKELQKHYPALKAHKTDDGNLKLYAGQLIELAGMKNVHDEETGMATWKTQALVLINEHATSTKDLLAFKRKIVTSVHAAFGITLKQEPELIGNV